MARIIRRFIMPVCLAAVVVSWPSGTLAQHGRPAPAAQHRAVVRGNVVFVGGYFYDPFYGPYPWWPTDAYPYRYFPLYDAASLVRVIVTPKDAAVYADGFYAGTVHDFNDWWQGLPLSPGGHEIVVYLEGYKTLRTRVYLQPGATFKIETTLPPLAAGEASETPAVAPPVPVPPDGTFTPPHTPRAALPTGPAPDRLAPAAAPGTLRLNVEPLDADVRIDGERWVSSDGMHFLLDLDAGIHRLVVAKAGFKPYSTEIQLAAGQATRVNVALTPLT